MAIDFTTGTYLSGKRYVSFAEAGAGAGTQRLVNKDNTTTKQHFFIHDIWLQCGSAGNIAVFDGSEKGNPLVRLYPGDNSAVPCSQHWGFGDRDPVDLTNEDGTCLCISNTGTGQGFIKYSFGV